MRFFVKVKANSKKESVEKIDSAHFEIQVKEPAQNGKANSAVIAALSDYLNVSKPRIKIISGWKTKQKILSIS